MLLVAVSCQTPTIGPTRKKLQVSCYAEIEYNLEVVHTMPPPAMPPGGITHAPSRGDIEAQRNV
jgi:hypothetical protein